jgi:hypothetical protein
MNSGKSFITEIQFLGFASFPALGLNGYRFDNVMNLVWPAGRRIAGNNDADHSFCDRNDSTDFELGFVRAAANCLAISFLVHRFQRTLTAPACKSDLRFARTKWHKEQKVYFATSHSLWTKTGPSP